MRAPTFRACGAAERRGRRSLQEYKSALLCKKCSFSRFSQNFSFVHAEILLLSRQVDCGMPQNTIYCKRKRKHSPKRERGMTL